MLGIPAGMAALDDGLCPGTCSGGSPRSSSGKESAYGSSSDPVGSEGVWAPAGVCAEVGPAACGCASSPEVSVTARDELYSDVHAAISAEFDVSSRLAPATTAWMSRSLPIRYR